VLQQYILRFNSCRQSAAQSLAIVQVRNLYSQLCILIGIERGNPRLGRAELPVSQTLLLKLIEADVERQNKLGAVGYSNNGLRNSFAQQRLQLLQQTFGIERHSRTDHVHDTWMKDAGWQHMQSEFAKFVDDRMPRIVASLEPDDVIRLRTESVRQLAFPFVSPIRSHNSSYPVQDGSTSI
jgi:hypothetical protein